MTPEQRAAIQTVLDALLQFTYGPIGPGTPWQGLVVLTAKQYKELEDLVRQQS